MPSEAAFPRVFGGTQGADFAVHHGNSFTGLGGDATIIASNKRDMSNSQWDNGANGWEGLLDLDTEAVKGCSSSSRARSAPPNEAGMQRGIDVAALPGLASYGSDLAWKTILNSVVEVEGVGEVTVVRVLQEIWRRGGGDTVSIPIVSARDKLTNQVTAQSLWPNIIMCLSLPTLPHAGNRLPTPSPDAATALKQLYNLTLKLWEPSIFCGLLGSYTAPAPIGMPSGAHIYGSATPAKELDLSMWTNMTPGADDLSSLLGIGNSVSRAATLPSSLAFEYRRDHSRRPSDARDADDGIRGIDELLAAMEERQEESERLQHEQKQRGQSAHMSPAAFQLPTPETEIDTPRSKGRQVSLPASTSGSFEFSPESMQSPYVTGSSHALSAVSTIVPVVPKMVACRAAHPTQCPMPTSNFVPPPPMCMFFNPSFHDLQNNKVGVWRGELEVKGNGGGIFQILIVGEAGTGHLW